MTVGAWTPLDWLAVAERELLLFAGVFFVIGLVDEFAVDCLWAWFRLIGRAQTLRIHRDNHRQATLAGQAALLIPAWQEERVLATTIAHALRAWPQQQLRLYVGCYRNDLATAESILRGSGHDARVRLVVHDREGPTTKADCLNRLYAAMEADERRSGRRFRMIVQHDAEDMVDPAALGLLDAALERADFVQLPVLPVAQPGSRWIGSHYCEEFAEAHGKAMVVRGELGVALPAAGVGCAFQRDMLGSIAADMREGGPFAIDSLTEDYELGLKIKASGGRSRFLRARGEDGRLVATRACFPAQLPQAVKQKARWVHGIAFQGWDRLGWGVGLAECWMRLRDRRGPLAALVLFAGYALLALATMLWMADTLGFARPWQPSGALRVIMWINLASFVWRTAMRFAFTAREYGWIEGVRAVMRLPCANVIAIMAGRRALGAYVASLRGARLQWEKTPHHAHPLDLAGASVAA
jgi:bacteriophage N4 adsorption protein B